MMMPARLAEFNSDNMFYNLCLLSNAGLERMYNKSKKRFSYKYKYRGNAIRNEGTSLRYTLISLIGINQYVRCGCKSKIDIGEIFNNIIQNIGEIKNTGDIGLFLWLVSEAYPERLNEFSNIWEKEIWMRSFGQMRNRSTLELSWLLTGVSSAAKVSDGKRPGLKQTAEILFNCLKKNLGYAGIFGHASEKKVPARLRNHIGTFADQIYPIHALSTFGRVFNCNEATQIGLNCAKVICEKQGQFGQWWWHYDSRTGDICRKYPVYSVHQDGMGPMGLFSMSEASGHDFTHYIEKGIKWIFGFNELNFRLIDYEKKIVWRSIAKVKIVSMLLEAIHHLKVPVKERDTGRFRNIICKECRSYHLGWILYNSKYIQR
jgi:hypothetical protein